MTELHEAFLTRLDALPDEALLEVSEPGDEIDEREHGFIDEDCDHEP